MFLSCRHGQYENVWNLTWGIEENDEADGMTVVKSTALLQDIPLHAPCMNNHTFLKKNRRESGSIYSTDSSGHFCWEARLSSRDTIYVQLQAKNLLPLLHIYTQGLSFNKWLTRSSLTTFSAHVWIEVFWLWHYPVFWVRYTFTTRSAGLTALTIWAAHMESGDVGSPYVLPLKIKAPAPAPAAVVVVVVVMEVAAATTKLRVEVVGSLLSLMAVWWQHTAWLANQLSIIVKSHTAYVLLRN